jgi:long-chain acyl-CoA synthetase
MNPALECETIVYAPSEMRPEERLSMPQATTSYDTAPLNAAIDDALAEPSLCAAFHVTVAANADRPALQSLGGEDELTYREYAERVRAVASGLSALGVRPGDAVGLMLGNCSEFHIVDNAAMHLGAAPFSIYFSNPPEQIEPMIRNARSRVVFAAPEYVEKTVAVQRATGIIEHIVVLGDQAGAGSMTLAQLEALAAPADFNFEATWRAIGPDDIAGIVYTSGTTGEPKGVEWSHGALLDNLRGLYKLAPPSPAGRWVSYLPMAHLTERFMSHYSHMVFGYTITTASDVRQVATALPEVRPTRFFAVPRIYEKLGDGAKAIAAGDDVLREALETSLRAVEGAESGDLDPGLAVAGEEARVKLHAIRERLGLDQTEYRGSAGAPMRVDTHHVFTALGLPVAEVWGMSETAMTVANPPDRIKMGTVGKPQPGVEAKLAQDGELLVRGPIFTRYRDNPELTKQGFDPEGYFHTGDIAAIDDDGYYRIVDRKKEIIINAAGKNVAPAMVENRVKQQSPIIGHAVAIGDARSYIAALIVLDEEGLTEYAAGQGLNGGFEELTHHDSVHAEVARAVVAANQTLARVEQIKKHLILEGRSWVPGSDEVTQTMKLKRRVINQKYADEIESLYR